MNKQHAKDEVVKCLKSAEYHLESAILSIRAGRPVSEVRSCYTRIRECIADTQEYLRELKKLEVKR